MAIIAFGGGLSTVTKRYLKATNKYTTFYELVHDYYMTVFGNAITDRHNGSIRLEGGDLPFALPLTKLPKVGNYSKCQPNVFVNRDCYLWVYHICSRFRLYEQFLDFYFFVL